jgi:hypothetical protein
MNKEFKAHSRAVTAIGLIVFVSIWLISVGTASGQHEGHSMPNAAPAKVKPKTARAKQKSKRKVPRRAPAKGTASGGTKTTSPPAGHIHTPGMAMPAPESKTPPAQSAPAGHEHTPGMVMPSSPPAQAPAHVDHSPGIQKPAPSSPTPAGAAPVQHDMHKSPAETPVSPEADRHREPHSPVDHPAPASEKSEPPMDHSKMADPGATTKPMPGMNAGGAHAMGPLLLMNGNEMSIRVGSSEVNATPNGPDGLGNVLDASDHADVHDA